MTDNEIIRALECCNSEGSIDCNRCPMWGGYATVKCIKNLLKNALDLSNRQKAEIEELTELAGKRFDGFASEYDSKMKSEAIKEFAERLKNNIDNGQLYVDNEDYVLTIYHISKLVKEMTEGKDNA